MTPLRLARLAATPTPEEYAARKGRGPAGGGITQGELGARVRAIRGAARLGASVSEICRWEKPPDAPMAVPM